MPVMTAADLVALAHKKGGGLRQNDPTLKRSAQLRRQRREAQIAASRLTPKSEHASPRVKPEPMDVDMPSASSSANAAGVDIKPTGTYTDYTILSKVIDGETYCLMKFKAPNPNDEIDIKSMPPPFRLNRKNPKAKGVAEDVLSDYTKEPKWRVLRGLDGREVIGKDGKPVMGATVEGREILQVNWGKEKEKMTKAELEAQKAKKKAPFKKKTRQVFTANPESKMDYNERFPWVFESRDERDSWTGRKQNFDDGSAYGILTAVPGHPELMHFIPIPLRYDFVMTKTHAASKSAEAAEAELADVMKRGSLLYQMNRRANGAASAATLATLSGPASGSGSGSGSGVKKEEDGDGGGLFGSDDEDVKREKGDGGDVDEVDFEEEHADDEENVEPEELEDEDTKESKARIKREQIAANKTLDAGIDDDDDSDDDGALTREGRRMKKALRKQGMAYDSDDEDGNPYASEESDDDDDGFLFRPPPPAPESKSGSPTPSGTPSPTKSASGSRPSSSQGGVSSKDKGKGKESTPATQNKKASSSLKPPPAVSRGNSPLSGSAIIAQRATSPIPKKKGSSRPPSVQQGGGRATSPLAGGAGSRATSPLPPNVARSTPSAAPASRAQSPAVAAASPLKRKAGSSDDTSPISVASSLAMQQQPSTSAPSSLATSPSADHIKKKAKKSSNNLKGTPASSTASSASPAPETFPGMITEDEVRDVMRRHPSGIVSTSLIALFRKRFADEPRNKKVLSTIVKRLANSEPAKGTNSYLLTAKPGVL